MWKAQEMLKANKMEAVKNPFITLKILILKSQIILYIFNLKLNSKHNRTGNNSKNEIKPEIGESPLKRCLCIFSVLSPWKGLIRKIYFM